MRDPTDLEGQAADAASAEEDAKARRLQWVEDIKWLMAHAAGRRIVSRLLDETAVMRTSFHGSGSVMALNEGRKQLGYFLTGELLDIAPDAYLKLLKEYRT